MGDSVPPELFPDVIETPCAGIDVHQRSVCVCVIYRGAEGQPETEVRQYDTKRKNLQAMAQWFQEMGVTEAAIESTDNYWRPVFDQLETVCKVMLLNPYFVKRMPGKKTDVRDCRWLAQLLKKGMLRGSFIPPQEIRNLRDLDAAANSAGGTRGEGKQ